MTRAVVICFLGIDGSGKTTLSNLLVEELQRRGFSTRYVRWLECEDSQLRRTLRRFVRASPGGFDATREVGTDGIGRTLVGFAARRIYVGLVVLDYLRYGLLKTIDHGTQPSRSVVVFDRYYFDTLLALSNEFDFSERRRRSLCRLFRTLLPSPDIVFIIDVPMEISYQRRMKDYGSISNAEFLWSEYQNPSKLLGESSIGSTVVRIDNTRNRAIVEAELLEITLGIVRNAGQRGSR